MGSGYWSATTYHDRAIARGGGDAFAYSGAAVRSGDLRPHQSLDPSGMRVRESRDSEEHPDSNAIIISLDVTGSMGSVVRGIHQNLPNLHELLLGRGAIAHPQILFAAVGDATCDRIPLQVGQFESDNRMEQNLENIVLEGGGGGQMTESYELMLYVAARHTAIDCWEKRRRKGYLFMIGDELAYPKVKRREVGALIRGGLQQDLPLAKVVAEVKERYHVYFVIPGGASNGRDQRIEQFWARHLGSESILHLEDPEQTSEAIGVAIGRNEGTIRPEGTGSAAPRRGVVGRTLHRMAGSVAGLMPAKAGAAPPTPRRL